MSTVDRQFCIPFHKLLDEHKQKAVEKSAIVISKPEVERTDASRSVLCASFSGFRGDLLVTGSADGKMSLYRTDTAMLMPNRDRGEDETRARGGGDALPLLHVHDFGLANFVTHVGFASSLLDYTTPRRGEEACARDYLFASTQRQLKVFRVDTLELISRLRTSSDIKHASFVRAGRTGTLLVAVAPRASTKIVMYNPLLGEPTLSMVCEIDVAASATCFAFRGNILAIGTYGPAITVMDLVLNCDDDDDDGGGGGNLTSARNISGRRRRLVRDPSGRGGHTRAVTDLRFLPPRSPPDEDILAPAYLLSASEDRTCILWRIEDANWIALRTFAMHTDFLTSCSIVSPIAHAGVMDASSPRRFVIAAASADKSTSVCAFEEDGEPRRVMMLNDAFPVRGVALSADGTYAATASHDRIRLYDLIRGERLNMLHLAHYARRRVSPHHDAAFILRAVWSMYV